MVEIKDQSSTTSLAITKNQFNRIKPEHQQQHHKRSLGVIANLKQEMPWDSDDDIIDNDDYHNLSDIDDERNKNSEIVYMEEPDDNRQLTHDELAEYLEFIPEEGEKREGVWSEIFKTDKDGVEFKVMHVKPLTNDTVVGDSTTIAETAAINEKTGLIDPKIRSPTKRGPYKKGPKTPKMCQLCGNTYRNQSLLDGHMRRHMNDRPYECQ